MVDRFLIKKNAINIHMGISPIIVDLPVIWAIYDGNPSYVGATIHLLSKGLDSGDIFHCLPKPLNNDGVFDFTMRSVLVAQQAVANSFKTKKNFFYLAG